MADKEIKQYTEETIPVAGDWYLMQKASNDDYVKVGADNIIPSATVTSEKTKCTVAFYATGSSQATAQDTVTEMVFDDEDYDEGGDFASSTFVAPLDGIYHFGGRTEYVSSNTNRAYLVINVDDVFAARGTNDSNSNLHRTLTISSDLKLTAGQEVKLGVFRETTTGGYPVSPFFWGHLVGTV